METDAKKYQYTRIAWVTQDAREKWEPILLSLQTLSRDLAFVAVRNRIVKCCCLTISLEDVSHYSSLAADFDLTLLILSIEAQPSRYNIRGRRHVHASVIIGEASDVRDLRNVLEEADNLELYCSLLGYPECCKDAVTERFSASLSDHLWEACRAGSGVIEDGVLEIEQESHAYTNHFFSCIGIKPVFHLPCSCNCEETANFSASLFHLAAENGYGQYLDLMREVLALPLQASVKNGNAEIKSPYFKLIRNSDVFLKMVVRINSSHVPRDMPRGTSFPYNLVSRNVVDREKVRRSGSYSAVEAVDGNWQTGIPRLKLPMDDFVHRDNGFKTFGGMILQQKWVLDMCLKFFADGSQILDLGCGNGFLLSQILARCPSVIPYGVENDPAKIANGIQVLPLFADNLYCCSIQDFERWDKGAPYTVIMIAVSRFEEMTPTEMLRAKTVLSASATNLLVYDYWCRHLPEICSDLGLVLKTYHGKNCGIATFSTDSEILNAPRLMYKNLPVEHQ